MDLAPWLTFVGALTTAIITVIGTIYVARTRTRVDVGASITTGFRELTDQLQEERNQLSEIIRRQREDLAEAERAGARQAAALRKLRRHCALLEDRLAKAGIAIPPPPN
ncbi:hypothetical protein [Rhizobium mulingense]|uniref:Uncharacterized protein n=1 Tax=Rhizobium mulingense TaxID=3031128 RepID=A0ACC6N4Q9_9HYPH|nr:MULTISPECIES: hypothetical protein [unclassified Rhizobium]MEA3520633.1 hypothetical protein [Rhizobium sp. MJ31]